MMGHHARSESLFYYFRLEDQVPENHLLRLIDKHISFDFVRERLKESYSETGRPSIDPELLLRILLIGYLYGITSERKLVEELRMHLAWRWFTGLGFDQEIPHHSTFSKNRHGRFQESKLFEQLFEQIVRQCVEVDWYRASICRWMAASWQRTRPRRVAFRESSWRRPPRCTTPCASICGKWKSRTRWKSRCMSRIRFRPPIPILPTPPRAARRPAGLLRQLSGDNHSCVIVGVQATAARMSQETVTARASAFRSGKDESRNRWRPIRRTGTGSSCNG